ncbi:MAG: MFS transporter [Casimicrobiaceae bacterium]
MPTNPAGNATIALVVTLGIQAFTSFVATATAVLAPEIGPAIGFNPRLIGVFVGMIYVGGMFASLASGSFIERYGPIRVSQVCVLLCAGGLALVAGPAWALPIAPLLIGLGYGAITPASSQLLARTASPQRMALTFSIKQTGVPLGAALSGLALPVLVLAHGWRATLLAVALFGPVIALIAQPTRAALDAGRRRDHRASLAGLLAPLRLAVRNPKLVQLMVAGFAYAAMQICLMSYLVVYLTETLGRSLIAAGVALTIANVGGSVGRIGWGIVADRWLPPRRLLGTLGIVAGTCALVTAGFGPGWPTLAILVVCALFGATAIGWNGVQLAEIARNSPPGQAGVITGASGFVTFFGVVIGPPLFALLVALTGSYGVGFAAIGGASLFCGVWLLRQRL